MLTTHRPQHRRQPHLVAGADGAAQQHRAGAQPAAKGQGLVLRARASPFAPRAQHARRIQRPQLADLVQVRGQQLRHPNPASTAITTQRYADPAPSGDRIRSSP